ncbi:signal transduction histidine kinase [Nocardiopsis mwathae]|uniref:Signal transduction histidine-protein kinase/phosphatase MprB n=1 Tax=Nocardiopsis mwathae TaxID=1472723 RepID=A0A7W9YES8_9ACTN|nr:HAMP domain-containing sensor histidine kinase [Nocardiopsis mwathae]MBB6170759.1 signal transduction histidine kinase [Nocardiopsis mwathae]
MRPLLARSVAIATTLVALVLIVVITLLAWGDARERAESDIRLQAGMVAAVVAVDPDPEVLRRAVATTPSGQQGRLAVHLPDGTTVGASRANAEEVRRAAAENRELTSTDRNGTAYLLPVRTPPGAEHVGDGAAGDNSVVEIHLPRGAILGGLATTVAGLFAVAVLAVVGAVVLTDRLTRPVRAALVALADTASAIGRGRLDARIRVFGPQELARLGESINAIGDQVQGLLAKEREMAADVSHRLRTPLTALRLDAETLTGPEAQRIRDAVSALDHDVDAIIRSVRPARSEADRACDLAEAVRDRMSFWSMLAHDQGREVEVDLPDRPVRVALSREECAAVVDAMVSNVFHYTPAGCPLAVTVVAHAGWITLVVEDGGPGIADPAAALRRGTSGGGSTGLGLDIARHAVEATGGTIHIERGKLGGARVRLRFGELGVPHEEDQPKAWRLRRRP